MMHGSEPFMMVLMAVTQSAFAMAVAIFAPPPHKGSTQGYYPGSLCSVRLMNNVVCTFFFQCFTIFFLYVPGIILCFLITGYISFSRNASYFCKFSLTRFFFFAIGNLKYYATLSLDLVLKFNRQKKMGEKTKTIYFIAREKSVRTKTKFSFVLKREPMELNLFPPNSKPPCTLQAQSGLISHGGKEVCL